MKLLIWILHLSTSAVRQRGARQPMRPEHCAKLASGRRLHTGSYQKVSGRPARPAACSVPRQGPYSLVGRRLAAVGAAALLTVCMAKGALQRSKAKLSAQQDIKHGEERRQTV